MTTNTTITTTGFQSSSDYDAYIRNLCGETVEIDTMGGAQIIAQKIAKTQNWMDSIEARLNGPEELEYEEFIRLLNTREFLEFEMAVLTDKVGGPLSRWWNRLHLSGVEYGGVEDGDALDTAFAQTDEEDGGAAPIFEGEMDNEWWEEQFAQPSGLAYTDEETGEKKFAINWDHLNKVAEVRDGLFAHLMHEVSKANSIRNLVRITKWAGLWSWHAQQRNGAEKGCLDKATTVGIDFSRYAQVCNAATTKACEMSGYQRAASLISRLGYTTDEDGKVREQELKGKFRPWLSKKLPGLKVFAVKTYENPSEENDSEDILDRGAAQGEFCADAEFALVNKVSVELAAEETCRLFDEARRNLRRPAVTSFRMKTEDVLDWMREPVMPIVATPNLTVTLGELFNL